MEHFNKNEEKSRDELLKINPHTISYNELLTTCQKLDLLNSCGEPSKLTKDQLINILTQYQIYN